MLVGSVMGSSGCYREASERNEIGRVERSFTESFSESTTEGRMPLEILDWPHEPVPPPDRLIEQWFERIEVGGHLVGRSHVTAERLEPPATAADPPGEPPAARRTVGRTVMSMRRFGDESTMRLVQVSDEAADGRVVAFRTVVDQGDGPTTTTGQRDGNRFRLTVTDRHGQISPGMRSALLVPSNVGGFFAVEQSLAQSPLKPGEQRTLDLLVPVLDVVGRVTMTRRETRQPPLPEPSANPADAASSSLPSGNEATGPYTVDTRLAVTGTTIVSHYDLDASGAIRRTVVPAARQTTIRVDRAAFDRAGDEMEGSPDGKWASGPSTSDEAYDIGIETLIPLRAVGHGSPDARLTKADLEALLARPTATYRVELSPQTAMVFPGTETQLVRPTEDHRVVDIIVRASVVPQGEDDTTSYRMFRRDGASAELLDALRPGPMIQSDDHRIREIVDKRRLERDNPSPAVMALDLTAFVHAHVEEKNFSRAFASAADVLDRPEGDCTEHAVLLAALLRAARIPARCAVGLVVIPDRSEMAYHMWTEAYLGDRWYALDATRPGPRVGPDRITVVVSDLSEGSGYAALLPVINLLDQMTVAIRPTETTGPARPAPGPTTAP